jgi:secondary thiamine-phosphate synthase enzyme
MVVTRRIGLKTQGNGHILDITRQVAQEVADSDLKDGTVTVFVSGSTGGVTTVEYESGLLSDLQDLFDRLVPTTIHYQHNLRWGDGNGHAHVRASLLGPSLTVPFVDKRLTLGTWQQVIFIDFDNRPRSRDLVLQLMGE